MSLKKGGSWEEFRPQIEEGILDQPAGNAVPLTTGAGRSGQRGPEDPVRWGELDDIRLDLEKLEQRFINRGIVGAQSFFRHLVQLLTKRIGDLSIGEDDDGIIEGACYASRGGKTLKVAVRKKAAREFAKAVGEALDQYEQRLAARVRAFSVAEEAERRADQCGSVTIRNCSPISPATV